MRIDLNADIGESFGAYKFGEDDKLLSHITSANIACGFHAGDFHVMSRTVKLAKEKGVGVGAHPGYPDIQGFGRRELVMTPQEIYEMVIYQIGALQGFCKIYDVPLQHVKPHGALYNAAAVNRKIAEAIAEAVYDVAPESILFGLCNSELILAGKQRGLKTAAEAFADRRYTDEGKLVSRQQPHAVLPTFAEILEQVKQILLHQRVQTESGQWCRLQADTICFHGDGANVAEHTAQIRQALENEEIKVLRVGI
ncbi:LamB/YcsF family protein [Mesobacillus maritimus]|uniref:LamB/YcsF family protein n=1 Tax=Mesobacillus maritimus TaxID=1643336 RepID=UPI00203EF9C7|nr:5-oxoprolinase subunit PxpA [Mesobacillus maritimus]MCM3668165.1 LamB/YcsF family protein [Mesobacillus maritimus]